MEYIFKKRKPIVRFVRHIITYCLIVFLFIVAFKKSILSGMPLVLGVTLLLPFPIYTLFFQYYFNDKDSSIKFDKSNNNFIYQKSSKVIKRKLDEIKLIEMVGTPRNIRKGSFQNIWQDDFFYYRFVFTDGEIFIMTCFMCSWKPINEVNFKDFNFTKRAKFFPFL